MAFEPTDDEIGRLVRERKPLPADYRRKLILRPKTGHKEQQLDVKGADGSEFRLILRQSDANPLDFSIILGYRVPKTNVIYRLRRYNGRHGEHTNMLEGRTFYDHHVHMATARYREAGLREDAYAEPTGRYSDFRSALGWALKECEFEVPENPQGTLFEV